MSSIGTRRSISTKTYLGDHADRLPGSALLFPQRHRRGGGPREGVVRTVLSVSEQDKSMTFAGDIPATRLYPFSEGGECRLKDQTVTITALAEA